MEENASSTALDNLGSALKQLLIGELIKLGPDAAEAVTRIHADGGKLRFEIELTSSSLSVLCSMHRGDHARVDVFQIEGVSTSVLAPKDN